MKRKGGYRRGTRKTWAKHWRTKGKISITRFLAKYEEGQKVALVLEPSYMKGIYHSRFHGLTGVVKTQRGKCYEVDIRDGNKHKIVIVHPVHLKRVA